MFLKLDEKTLTVRSGIRDLIDRVLLPEDLEPGWFEPDPAARTRVHRAFQESVPGAGLEVPLSLEEECSGYRFIISGRADMVEDLPGGGFRVTEVKTVGGKGFGRSGRIPSSFPMQLYFYARALAGGSPDLPGVSMRLVILPCVRGDPPPVEIPMDDSREEMDASWRDMLRTVAGLLDIWRARRRRQLDRLSKGGIFPFASRRPGQERLEKLSAEAVSSSGRVLVEAPTGIGKTAAILAGALREAIPAGLRVFLLTSKNTQRRIALETFSRMAESGLDLAVAVMDSRERMCALGNARCRAGECPYSQRFGSRVRGSRVIERLLDPGLVEPAAVRSAAIEAGVCPYELSLARARHCDLILGDFNYAFDPSVRLGRFFDEPGEAGRNVLLVDEAANLPSRAREYYSPAIESSLVDAAFPLPKRFSTFRGLLNRLRESLAGLAPDLSTDGENETEIPRSSLPDLRPEAWLDRLSRLDVPLSDELYNVIFAVMAMARVSDIAGRCFHLIGGRNAGGSSVQWFCTDASPFTGECFAACRAAVCFSATLRPAPHHRDLLGLPPDTVLETLPWPFQSGSLSVWVDRFVDTRYRARARSMPMLVKRVSMLREIMPGTYVLFFPSYGYMDAAASALAGTGARLLVQRPGMDQGAREAFMSELEEGGRLVLTVSGGIFSEGVDLRAPDLRGAAVAGPSLPSVDLRNRLLAEDFTESGKNGFDCASVIPGMARVVQAVGRLVRKPGDRAVVLLFDGRFLEKRHSDLFPEHWLDGSRPRQVSWSMKEIGEFWAGGSSSSGEEGPAQA